MKIEIDTLCTLQFYKRYFKTMLKKAKNRFFGMAIIVIALLFLIFGFIIVKQRSFSYGYNQRMDYQHQFNPEYASTYDVPFEGKNIDLSTISTGSCSVFAEINIRSMLKGFINEPEVKMIACGDTVFQDFECRANGKRYLNLSSLAQKGARVIQLEMKGCKLKGQTVKVFTCRNTNPAMAKILILAPHPDDAEIAVYGLYASNARNTFIATITAGDAGSMRYDELYSDSVSHYIEKGKIRAWNSTTVPQLGGIAPEHCINLGYFDASLKNMHNDTTAHGMSRYIKTYNIMLFRSANCTHLPDSVKPESNWRSLVTDLKYLLLNVRPTIVVTPYPALDWHFDHKFTTVALLQAMQELQYDSCRLWLYTNHLPLTEMYPDGKIGSASSLPPSFSDQPIYFDRLCSFPLSSKLQSEKVLALDAMNDLRPDTQYRDTKASWLQTKKNFWDKLYLKESDYFRRSVRSNELFFVIEGKNAFDPVIQSKILGKL